MSRGPFTVTDYLRAPVATVSQAPCTLVAWGMGVVPSSFQILLDVHNSTSTTGRNCFNIGARSGVFSAYAGSGITTGASSQTFTILPKDNVWFHVAGVFTSSIERLVYVNGTPGTVNTTSLIPTGIDEVNVGVIGGTTKSANMGGYVAHAAIWDVALSPAEILSLYRGVSPLRVRRANLIGYWPLDSGATTYEFGLYNNAILQPTGVVLRGSSPPGISIPNGISIEMALGLGGVSPPNINGTAISAGGGATKSVGTSQRATTAKSAGGGVARSVGASSKSGTAKSIGGGVARGIGSSIIPVSGSAKSAGGGASASAGTSSRLGSAKSAGGGSARAQGIGANLGIARVAGGGTAKPVSQGSPGHTGSAVSFGGGAARAIGVQNVGILGTARTAGGGAAVSPTLANRIGWAIVGGGGAARATAQGATHSGFAAAAGGGAAKAFGAVTPPPSSVDHYIHGWPVSKSGAVIVRIMP